MENKKLIFYNLIDFFPKKEIIKIEYDLLTLEEKKIYKMYIYSLPFMEDDVKDGIWEYLNGWLEDYDRLCRKYTKVKRKYEKRKREAMLWGI